MQIEIFLGHGRSSSSRGLKTSMIQPFRKIKPGTKTQRFEWGCKNVYDPAKHRYVLGNVKNCPPQYSLHEPLDTHKTNVWISNLVRRNMLQHAHTKMHSTKFYSFTFVCFQMCRLFALVRAEFLHLTHSPSTDKMLTKRQMTTCSHIFTWFGRHVILKCKRRQLSQ